MTCVTTIDLNPENFVDKLNDDCLIHIFEYLPIVDRIRSEAVSKRWKKLINQSWSSYRHFDFRKTETWSHCRKDFREMINDKIFKNLMDRFGSYLTHIVLSFGYKVTKDQLTPNSILYICQFCQKLQALRLDSVFRFGSDDWNEKVIRILQNWKLVSSLKKFAFDVRSLKPDILSSLISKMECLNSIQINFFRTQKSMFLFEDSFLSKLPLSNLTEIIFEHCYQLEESLLIETVKSIPNLNTIYLMYIKGFNVFHHLSKSQSEALENLCVRVTSGYKTLNLVQDIQVFQNFVNLKKLNLANNYSLVVDTFLETLALCCKELIFLDISENEKVTDKGIQHVVSLPKLQYLFIRFLNEVTGKFLSRMPNLEVLDCTGSCQLEDKGLCAIVRHSKLRFLSVTNNSMVTNELLRAVVEEMSTRTINLDMIFKIDNTMIDASGIKEIPTLLRVVKKAEASDNIFVKSIYFPKNETFFEVFKFQNYTLG